VSATLHRPLLSGLFFNALFPLPDGKKVNLGAGDTNTSIELIIQWALKHHHEVEKVAPLFLENELEKTCFNIHHFLFNHFQYKADDSAQLLRSPAYAWKERKSGIDCKSYSIIASCILLQLGVKHYIRKIKQPSFNPDAYTHVYVIVPSNQNTGSLKNGYFTIDGTLPTTLEPNYIATKDFFMDKLKHYGLNGLYGEPESSGGSSSSSGSSSSGNGDNPPASETDAIAQLAEKLNNSILSDLNIFDMFRLPISCWGGSAFSGERAESEIKMMDEYFRDKLLQINVGVEYNNSSTISEAFADFEKMVFLGIKAYNAKNADGWNKCTTESINQMVNVLSFYKNVVYKALLSWLDKYYDREVSGRQTFVSDGAFEATQGFFFSYQHPYVSHEVLKYKFTRKPNIDKIMAFEFTPYIHEIATNPSSFNAQTFLNGLATVLVSFTGNGNNGGGDEIDANGNNTYSQENTPKKTTNAGTYLVGFLAISMALGYAFNKTKDVKPLKN